MTRVNGDVPSSPVSTNRYLSNIQKANNNNLILRITAIFSLLITLFTGSFIAGAAVLLLGIAAHFSDRDPLPQPVYVQPPFYTRFIPFYNPGSRPAIHCSRASHHQSAPVSRQPSFRHLPNLGTPPARYQPIQQARPVIVRDGGSGRAPGIQSAQPVPGQSRPTIQR